MSTITLDTGEQLDGQAVSMMKAIKQKESGGNYSAVGDVGTSTGAYQFQPNTWKQYAKEVLGDENAQQTKENQNKVAYTKIKSWKDKGWTPEQVAAAWNAGEQRAQDGSWKTNVGTTLINGKEVAYDTPTYVKDVISLASKKGYQTQPAEIPKTSTAGVEKQTEGISSELGGRASQASKALSEAATGKISPFSGILQTVGAGAGAVNDVATKVLENIPLVGEVVKGAEALVGKGVGALAKTKAGQKVAGKIESYAEKNPEAAANISALGNIAGTIGLVTGAGELKNIAGKVISKGLGKEAVSSIVSDISPELKGKGLISQVSKKGGAKVSKITGEVQTTKLSPVMKETENVIKEVSPTFTKLGTFTEKIDSLHDGISDLAKTMRTNITKGEIQPILTPDDITVLENGLKTAIEKHPLLAGVPGEQAQRIFNVFKEYLPKGRDITMEDILDARQKLDSYISSIKPKAFDPATENAFTVALRAVRQGANSLIDSKVPEGKIKQLLRKQTLLYDAIDNMAPKAAKEIGTTKISRFLGRHPKTTGLIKKAGETAGIGLLGAGGYATYKGITGD
jgi:hypothetical protein